MLKVKNKKNYIILFVYAVFLLFYIYKMFFYAAFVQRTPDEICHISYVAYLTETNKVIPDFKDMYILNDYTSATSWSTTLNYLGHPPLYYQIMRLANAVSINSNGLISIDIIKLRNFNIILNAIIMLLVMYIGYSRINRKKTWLHLIYATVCTCIPMSAYVGSGINNDNLALLGVSVAILGILRFYEMKRDTKTYVLVGLGFFISMLSKLTAGLVVITALIIIIIQTWIREKSIRFLLKREFLFSLIFYLVPLVYLVIIHKNYGTFQPALDTLNWQQFINSGYYVAESQRVHLSFSGLTIDWWVGFFRTFVSIWSHTSLVKMNILIEGGAILLICFIPLGLIISWWKGNKHTVNATFPIFVGIIAAAIYQYIHALSSYFHYGRFAAYQSRYYLCAVAALALLCVAFWEKLGTKIEDGKKLVSNTNGITKVRKSIIPVISVIWCLAIIFQDFIYFIIYFKDYIK